MSFFDISWDKKHNKMGSHDKKKEDSRKLLKNKHTLYKNLWAYSREDCPHRYFPKNQEELYKC